MNATLIRRERLQEFTFSLTYAKGGTESLTIQAWSYADAEEKIAKLYPQSKINWII